MPRNRTACYAVLSISELRQLLAIAEQKSSEFYDGSILDQATVVLRGTAVEEDGKTQANFTTANGCNLYA